MFLKIICSHEKCAFICQLYANVMFSVKSLCLLLFFCLFSAQSKFIILDQVNFVRMIKNVRIGPGQFYPISIKCIYYFFFFVQEKAEKEFDPSSDSSGKEWQRDNGKQDKVVRPGKRYKLKVYCKPKR